MSFSHFMRKQAAHPCHMPLTCKRTWACSSTMVSATCVSSQEKEEISRTAWNHGPWSVTASTERKLEYMSQAKCQPVLDLGGQRCNNGSSPQRTLLQSLSGPSMSMSSQISLSVTASVHLEQPSQSDSVSRNKPSSFPAPTCYGLNLWSLWRMDSYQSSDELSVNIIERKYYL